MREPSGSRRGVTIAEVAVATACGGVLFALVGATAGMLGSSNGTAISMANTMEIGGAHALYATDHAGLQWCAHSSDFGLGNASCNYYLSSVDCPEQIILGLDQGEGLWGYWLGGSLCPPSFPGNCGNWVIYWPNEWGTTYGVIGAWRLMQARSFHDYLNGRFYDPVYFAPNDRPTYRRAAALFNIPAEYAFIASVPNPVLGSYCMSPAAMWNPDVMRGASAGGFQNPTTLPDSFERQPLFGASYPDLKSLVFERNWNQGGKPPAGKPSLTTDGVYRYNQSATATPVTLFYDGHVWFLPNAAAIADDSSLTARGQDGLWSRDTALGADGYYGASSVDGSRTSHSVLTRDGILGRDVLTAP